MYAHDVKQESRKNYCYTSLFIFRVGCESERSTITDDAFSTRFRRVDTWKVCETKAWRVGRDGSAPPKQRRRIIIIKRAVKVWTMWKLNIVTSETSCCCDVTGDSKQSSATAVVVLGSSRHGGRVYCLAVCILRCRSVSGEQVKQWKWRRFQVRCPFSYVRREELRWEGCARETTHYVRSIVMQNM